jgi:hypothetical protein
MQTTYRRLIPALLLLLIGVGIFVYTKQMKRMPLDTSLAQATDMPATTSPINGAYCGLLAPNAGSNCYKGYSCQFPSTHAADAHDGVCIKTLPSQTPASGTETRSIYDVESRIGDSYYFKAGNSVFYQPYTFYQNDPPISNVNLDLFTLVPGNSDYATDRFHIWYQGIPLKEAAGAVFRIIGTSDLGASEYGTDELQVWFRSELVPYADAKTFTLLSSTLTLGKDKDGVYYGTTRLNLNPATTVIQGNVIKDMAGIVYFNTDEGLQPVQGADGKSFALVGICGSAEKSEASYYKDNHAVYVGWEVKPDINAKTFSYLGNYSNHDGMPYAVSYAKDSQHVYSGCGKILENADQATFKVLEGGYAKDTNHVWFLGQIMSSADPSTFVSTGAGHAKDSKTSYYEGVDVATR